jgi:hypothetical protein
MDIASTGPEAPVGPEVPAGPAAAVAGADSSVVRRFVCGPNVKCVGLVSFSSPGGAFVSLHAPQQHETERHLE